MYNKDSMITLEALEQDIREINERNRKVELDKAWETSRPRRIFIGLATYLLISLFLIVLNVDRPFISAIIPAVGYFISTLSLGVFKSWWLRSRS